MVIAIGTVVACSSDDESTSSDCVSGISTQVDTSLPSWIQDNFKCQTVAVSGSNYTFYTTDQPNHASYYWGTSSSLYEDMPSGNMANNNSITAQTYTLTIPATPDSGASATSTSVMGVAVNGAIIYNNAAAPGSTLAAEADGFDNANGHPDSSGTYHYHVEPTKISNDDSALIGIALDGYAIYGKKDSDGTTPIDLDSNHGHTTTTTHFTTATYHYHVATDSTAGIVTLLGDNFKGTKGSVSQ